MSGTRSKRRLAQVLVCTGCCCGHWEKGRRRVPVAWLREQWAARELGQSIGLSITDCLEPCDQGNIVCLKQPDTTTWLGDLNDESYYEALLAWATASHAAGRLEALPALLDQHLFQPSRSTVAASRASRPIDEDDTQLVAPETV